MKYYGGMVSKRLTVIAGATALLPLTGAAAATVTSFNTEVASVFARHCVSCHNERGSMPSLPLTSYGAARAAATKIRDQVTTGKMPPWFADPTQSVAFRNDARLSSEEVNTVVAWVDGGASEGSGSPPSFPAPASGWAQPQGRAPDLIVGLPRVKIPANGELPYVRLLIKVTTRKDEWITGLQALPGNAGVVHHMGITEVTLADGVTPANMSQLDTVARQLGMPAGSLTSQKPSVPDPTNPAVYDMLSIYTPGTTYESFGSHAGKLLKAGPQHYINFNIHYTTTGKAQTDQSKLGLWLTSKPPEHQLYRAPMPGRTLLVNGRELLSDDPGTKAEGTDVAIPPIPPNEQHYELTGVTALLSPITIYALQPHAHLRNKSFRYAVFMPDGSERTLLNVPAYDFHWQLRYELAQAMVLPAGSKLVVTGEYDNSTRNAHLLAAAAEDPLRRCGPDKVVHCRDQNQTWDEMFSPLVEYTVPRATQPRRSVRLIAAVGCLTRTSTGGWNLGRIGNLQDTSAQSTSRTERTALAQQPDGTLSVRLLGMQPFHPDTQADQRVIAKGVLMTDPDGSRLNVTSLQATGTACAR